MMCAGCGNKAAFALRVRFTKEDGSVETCDVCGKVSACAAATPDVYWPGRGHYDDNIVDQSTGKPIFLESRRHKAQLMKEQGMREANDSHRGAPGHRFNKR
jgi:hypothetical protein